MILYVKMLAIFFFGLLILSPISNFKLFVCICILVLSYGAKLWAKVSLKKIDIILQTDKKRMFPDDVFKVDIKIENRKILPVLAKFEVASNIDGQLLSQETGLFGFSDFAYRWDVAQKKRGVCKIGPVKVWAGDLLGFHHIEKKYDIMKEIIVYPKLIQIKQVLPDSREYFGNNPSREFVLDPVLISGTREYGFSRPAKNIHWKASAKKMTLQEKIFEPSSHMKIFIIVDVKGFEENSAFDAFEKMLSTVASYVVFLSQKGISPGLAVNGFLEGDDVPLITPLEGSDHIYQLLEKLARLKISYNQKYDVFNSNREMAGKQTYLYFCCYPPVQRGLNWIKGNTVEIIASFQGENDGQLPCKVISINDLLQM